MIKKQVLTILIVLWLASACPAKEYYATNEDSVKYKVIFNATWSNKTHPTDFPPGAHFSGLIGVTHNAAVSLWKQGKISSKGIELMAETGQKNDLLTEINKAIAQENAEFVISGSGPLSPGSYEMDFSISPSHSLVTLVSMLAPSPDWFVGVRNVNLYENNAWVEKKVINLFVYDAGTDSGDDFTSADKDSKPKELISRLKDKDDFTNTPVGTFTFVKQ